jgi:hypothetical protein
MEYVPRRCLIALCLFSCAAAQQLYRDPQGRFTLQVPAGFAVSQSDTDAVRFANGSAYVTAMVLPGDNPALTISAIARQTAGQWRNFAQARSGDARFAGHIGSYATYSGTNPQGAESYLELLAITDGASIYLLITSAPKPDFPRLKSGFDQIEETFVLGAPPNPSVPPTSNAPPLPPRPNAPPVPLAPAGVQPSRPLAAAAKPASSTGQPGYYRMRLVRIVDEHGFEHPMTALTLLIPTGWKFQGNVQYNQSTGCHANMVRLVFQAESPDGRSALRMFPQNTWQWADDPSTVRLLQSTNQQMARFGRPGCDVQPPVSAGDFLRRTVIPAARSDARVLAIEPMPDVAQELETQAREIEQAANRQGISVRMRTDVTRARLSYTAAGQPSEEWLTAMTFSLGMPGPTFNMYTGRAGSTLYYTCGADHVLGFRAPQGQLDAQERLFRMILATIRVDSQWQARVSQVIASMAAADSKGAMDRSAIATKLGDDMSRMSKESNDYRNKSNDRVAENWSDYLRGVTPYRNPVTGEIVKLDNRYDNAWAGPKDEYVIAESANFNPNSAFQGNWTRLEPVTR